MADLRHIPIADLMSELVMRIVARDREALSAVTGLLSLLQMMGEYLSMAKRAALCSQLRDAADELERVLVVRVDQIFWPGVRALLWKAGLGL